MQTLKQRIQRLRRKNHEANYFITSEALRAELTEDDVRSCLLSSEIPPERYDEILRKVMGGAHRTFAILLKIDQLELFKHFLKTDEFQKSYFDDKLPMELSELERIFG